ncbi:MAG: class I SAM-dependent methyltransferase [Propylenella sp.]
MTLPSYAMSQASFPEMYERWLAAPLFRPWAELTLDEVGLSSGDRILDVACGTGIAARVAKERLGETGYVVGIDVSPDMLTVARSVAPSIDWREGNANDLPLRDGEAFDVVVCQQGLQFFPEKPAAVAKMRAALASDGRLVVATWRSDDEIPFFLELRRVAERRLGAIIDQRYSFGDAELLEALLRNAGFHEVRSKVVSRIIRFDDGLPFLRLNAMALVGMSAVGKGMDGEERKRMVEELVSDSSAALPDYLDGSGLAFQLSTNLATARA